MWTKSNLISQNREDSLVTLLALDKQQSGSSNHVLLITESALVIKKKSDFCLSLSAFSNFAPYVIKTKSSGCGYCFSFFV